MKISTLKKVKSAVDIPVSVILSPYYTNPLKLISEMDSGGANGFVLFNRLFQRDIDIDTEKHHFPYNLSNKEDIRLPMRFAGMLMEIRRLLFVQNTGYSMATM
jgi:dihydroorotate dehydrogenase (fumarate)